MDHGLYANKLSDLEGQLQKSEEKNEELQKSLSGLIEKLTKSVKKSAAPKQKAITKIEFIKKSEEENVSEGDENKDVSKLDKAEINSRLTAQARKPSLAKTDRDVINNYYLTETKDFESIRHLL